jgi:2-oxoacid:acceptor oxidoreductase delta subunit (pyruvate/2-ketoisovalerate family)
MEKRNDKANALPLVLPRTYASTEANKTGSWRYLRPRYENKTSPCSATCPAGEDIARIEMLAEEGLFKEAWETILRENPFPAVCGRVCFHPCEGQCNRREFDEAVAIHQIERFLADTARKNDTKPAIEGRDEKRPEKIAIAGAGPAGLAAAYFLTRLGYGCEIFETREEPGGVLRWGIPPYRLPLDVLRTEISLIQSLGVPIRTGTPLGPSLLEEAKGKYAAVFLGCGHSRSRGLGVPGEDLEGVEEGLPFLASIRAGNMQKLSGPVAVVGGGNSAVDVARSVARLGGESWILYRRRREDMPAFETEILQALEEGVKIRELVAPVRLERKNGRFLFTLQPMRIEGKEADGRGRIVPEGAVETMEFGKVFKAIGEEAGEEWYRPPDENRDVLRLSNCTFSMRAGLPVVVYGGDLAASVKSVVHAVASAKEGAIALDILFREGRENLSGGLRKCRVGEGPSLSMEMHLGGPRARRSGHVVRYTEINTDYFQMTPRITQPRLLAEERLRGFDEIDLKISANLAIREAERCFNCGLCNQCDNCYLFCPDMSVHRGEGGKDRRIDYDYCKGCGLCAAECPRNAMVLEEEEGS